MFLTCGTDVHPDRLESHVLGWGAGEELWPVEYFVIQGDPTANPLWEEYFDWLRRPRWIERGGVDYIRSTCIDSGYATQSVYGFFVPRSQYRLQDGNLGLLWTVKGQAGSGRFWPREPVKPDKKTKVPLYMIKVDTGKEILYRRMLKINEPGPGYFHFSLEFEDDYFRQLTAEHKFERVDKRGFTKSEWVMKVGRQRNEVLDTLNYGYAALWGAYQMGLDLNARAAKPPRLIPHPEPSGAPLTGRAVTAGESSPKPDPRPTKRKRNRTAKSKYLGG